jgi:hypothetical protein
MLGGSLGTTLAMWDSQIEPASGYAERAAAVRAAGTPEVVADAVVERWFTAGYADAVTRLIAEHLGRALCERGQ